MAFACSPSLHHTPRGSGSFGAPGHPWVKASIRPGLVAARVGEEEADKGLGSGMDKRHPTGAPKARFNAAGYPGGCQLQGRVCSAGCP